MRFSVKICGIKSLADARAVARAGGDAIGFNFFPQTARYVSPEAAGAIVAELPPGIVKVGVFVNETSGGIAAICEKVGLDCVQLHGSEPAGLLAELPASITVIRAFRLASGGLDEVVAFLGECDRRGRRPDAVLVDAHVPGIYGGTGRTTDWRELSRQRLRLEGVPLLLAGGLTPENVGEAVDTVRPSGVDAASGVEVSPGEKDHGKVRRFIASAKQALAYASAKS